MKQFIQASTIIIALLTVANVQAETGGAGGMHMPRNTEHHRLKGSSLHENAANYHTNAAKHHRKAAAMYRKENDSSAVTHAEAAILASSDAFKATEDTKQILPK